MKNRHFLIIIIAFLMGGNVATSQEVYRFNGSWITADENANVKPSPLFRKAFQTAAGRHHYGDGMRVKKLRYISAGLDTIWLL